MDSNDKRFAKMGSDPKFKRVPKDERKVKIDKRFQSIFNDNRFKVKYTIDKRGRPVSGSTNEDFRKFYHLDEESDDTNSEQGSNDDDRFNISDPEEEAKEKDKVSKLDLKNLKKDFARGDDVLSDSSSDDDSSSDEEKEEHDFDHGWGELDKDADNIEEATSRLALCNMDWDRVNANDLMILFNSFLPTDGFIKSIAIYPSEFGMKRLQEEETKGPPELISSNPKKIDSSDDSDQEEEEEGGKYHMEKLRKYQLARLKYYYAIIECNSPETANKLYTDCDGMEYESSAIRLDLRFVPDDTEFDQEPKEVSGKLPDVAKYKPHFFTTTALQQSKVVLTWDEIDPRRNELINKLKTNPKTEVDDIDLQKYVAFSSEDENSSDENEHSAEENNKDNKKHPIEMFKELLQNIQEEEEKKANKDTELEISWGIGAQEKIKKTVDEKSKKNLTPFQKMMEKKKEKLREKQKLKKEANEKKDEEIDSKNEDKLSKEQAELELLLMDEEPSEKRHFNMKKIHEVETKASKKKRNKKKAVNEKFIEDDFSVDVKDDRFAAMYTSHLFNIDPADPKFKRTKGMEAFISEKASRRQQYDTEKVDAPPMKKPKQSLIRPELSNLVKSIKNKTNRA